MTQPAPGSPQPRLRSFARIVGIALLLNVGAWIGGSLGPGAQASWRFVSLAGFFLLGLAIGRWWALLVTCAFGVIHAIPVYLGLLPGYLSTWGELLWWVFALALLVALTALGVLARSGIRRLGRRGAGLAAAALLAGGAGAPLSAQQGHPPPPVGTWRGTSVCLVRPSACNDEVVVYRIAPKAADSLTLDARKIVRGQEQGMGVLTCRYPSPHGPMTCVMPQGTWEFQVRNDSLVGELRLPDHTRFRDVRTVRVP